MPQRFLINSYYFSVNSHFISCYIEYVMKVKFTYYAYISTRIYLGASEAAGF